jgi:hypothetical protein
VRVTAHTFDKIIFLLRVAKLIMDADVSIFTDIDAKELLELLPEFDKVLEFIYYFSFNGLLNYFSAIYKAFLEYFSIIDIKGLLKCLLEYPEYNLFLGLSLSSPFGYINKAKDGTKLDLPVELKTPLIFNKKLNKSRIKYLEYINSDTGKARHFPPAAQE